MKRLALVLSLLSPSLAFAEEALPESLDRVTIKKAIAAVKPAVYACSKESTAKGIVRVIVKVAPSGTVETVEAKLTPDAKLGECVETAIKKATFPKTQKGGSFVETFGF